ncbi:alpha/beta hydrolase [Hyphobacterium marinum]|uniref:Alpha/beta hydrolase n=1 Tax=Hyphobacterium marinum TaxID=3116574 RepID=A0ABU7LVV6_9PROT|nr:alpha/beta hydrolase [Hyphobacterium sp. Y6023]MEE2565693.1 alpha/beta hydrolase [Hyphobacterium sp. Y6023]
MAQSGFERRTLDSPSGASLNVYDRPAQGNLRALLHVNHGLAEHAARYGKFAQILSGRGIHVCAHDHRGHGFTTAPDGSPRRFADTGGWDKVMTDVSAVEADLRARHPGVPLFVLGHSMGGTIAFNQVLRESEHLAGAAIWNANLSGPVGLLKFVLGLESLVGGDRKPATLIDGMTFKTWDKNFSAERSAFGWLSRDLGAVDAYVADPLCGWPAQISLWKDFAHGMGLAQDNAALKPIRKDFPLHLIGGEDDPATDGGKAVTALAERLRRQGLKDVTVNILSHFRHETVNEIGAEAEINKFADWIEQRL